MRIIAGRAKGLRLKVPKRVTRPSTDRLREALFSILGQLVPGATVLDLFAGSGALGIEALSRGAERATFIELNSQAAAVITENLASTRLEGGTVRKGDVFRELALMRGGHDLVFADPPYAEGAEQDLAAELIANPKLPELLAPEGLLVVEVESAREAPVGPGWELRERRTYGGSAILFYALREAP